MDEITSPISLLLLLNFLILVPLALRVVIVRDRNGNYSKLSKAIIFSYLPAAIMVTTTFYLPTGIWSALVASGWFIFSVLVAMLGIVRTLSRGIRPVEEFSIDAGLIYFPVGALWLILFCAGLEPMGFNRVIVLLTATHFHYAGFLAQIFTGMVGRAVYNKSSRWSSIFSLTALGVIFGPIMIAAGIAISHLYSIQWVEFLSVSVFTTSLMVVSLISTFVVVPAVKNMTGKILILASSVSIFAGMIYGLSYDLCQYGDTHSLNLSIPRMVITHGVLNSFGFGILGFIALNIIPPRGRISKHGIPFSLFRGNHKISSDFFREFLEIDPTTTGRGLVDDLSDYDSQVFSSDRVNKRIRSFYEETDKYDLSVHAEWKGVFRWLSPIYKAVSSYIGQMNFPVGQDVNERDIDSKILPLINSPDGRANVRGWVRRYKFNNKSIYVAAYSSHVNDSCRYMNIAFPFPCGNVSSILRLEEIPELTNGNGVLLTSLPRDASYGDEGIYFVNDFCPVRLPINETIHVRPGLLTSAIVAKHDMFTFGINFLTLHYRIFPKRN